MPLRFPVYIISKGRWESRQTAKALLSMDVPFRIVVEPHEYDNYAGVIDKSKILVLPFSNLGQGSIPARNWVWEHSIEDGAKRHWILDDNIREFYWLNNNHTWGVRSDGTFLACEEFVERYENIALAGMQYRAFARQIDKHNPFELNTRIYSCILVKNDIPYRWRGRYNEDTDLSLRALKDGWCTVLFYAFVIDKSTTLKMKGGNTNELYKDNGRLLMAQSLREQHPDVVSIKRRWGRWQHVVDYRPFKHNRLIKKSSASANRSINNYDIVVSRVDRLEN